MFALRRHAGLCWLLLAYGLVWLEVAISLGVRTPAPDWQTFHGMGRASLAAGRLQAATWGSWYQWAFICWWLAALRAARRTPLDTAGR